VLRVFRFLVLALAFGPAGAAPPHAFPDRPLRIVVAFPAGGANDLLARVLAPELSRALGQPVTVENRPGAGGNLGTEAVAKAAADGHTLLLGSTGPQGVAPSLYAKLPYDPATQILPVCRVATSGNLVLVHPGVPVRTVAELVALARAQPGKLSYASQGEGSTGHLAAELFRSLAKLDMVHVPYKGDSQALVDLASGQVQVLFAGVPPGLQAVNAGRVRLLASTPARRLEALPEVPTVSESGVPGYDVTTWYGLFATGGTDPAIVERIARETARILADPRMRQEIARMGMQAAYADPADFGAVVARDVEKWGRVVRAIGVRIE